MTKFLKSKSVSGNEMVTKPYIETAAAWKDLRTTNSTNILNSAIFVNSEIKNFKSQDWKYSSISQGSTKKQKATRRSGNGELIDIPVFRNRQRTNSVQMSILSKQIDTTN
jgi:hypothetical protein